MAVGQAVAGIVADGVEYSQEQLKASGLIPTRELMRPLVMRVVKTEQNNAAIEREMHSVCSFLSEAGVDSIVVKGQGIGRHYLRPNHRSAGDIDLLVRREDYSRARSLVASYADRVDAEDAGVLQAAVSKGKICIEVHGTLDARINDRIDKEIRAMQESMFSDRDFTVWNGVLLPSSGFDAVFIFIHILQHFYNGGIGFRQICDWCRFLSECGADIGTDLLLARLQRMKVLQEWKVFGNMAVRHLGMPEEKMPFYDASVAGKADRLLNLIFLSGNFGMIRGRDTSRDGSYFGKKYTSMLMAIEGYSSKFAIFPRNTASKIGYYLSGAMRKLLNGR